MDIKRLGSLHPTRLSFMRALVRKMMREDWHIDTSQIRLDDQGLGTVIYRIEANSRIYTYVLFAHYLADEDRNDRVIADQWDVTMTLCRGEVSHDDIERMRANVPKQEAGRATTQQIVMSRGNRSSRNFNYVVDCLSQGRQPELASLAEVGYLYRTTAVYGSGKFGMADWETVNSCCPEFASPFSAEMFNCFLLRDFSVRQAEHLAMHKSPKTAVLMCPNIKRFLGIGNSTGLGMAPYLIRHPQLISRWILMREKAIAQVTYLGCCTASTRQSLVQMLAQVGVHLNQTVVPDDGQTHRNEVLKGELNEISKLLSSDNCPHENDSWQWLTEMAAREMSLETQEMLNSLLMELHADLLGEEFAFVPELETQHLEPTMTVAALKLTLEHHYQWALQIDFSQACESHYFWYVSEEKLEPRVGERYTEPGSDKEQPLVIARRVRKLYDVLSLEPDQLQTIARWLLKNNHRLGIVTRVQTMAQECYGEIRGNLSSVDMLPLDLLRCKLSFFGVSKFDPKSKLWVRNTMFQGAPSLDEIMSSELKQTFKDDWYFPIAVAKA